MKPILFHLSLPFLDTPLEVRTYGVMIALGFLLMIPLMTRLAKKEGVSSNVFIDLAFWTLLWGLIGSRILFILTNLNEYLQEPLRVFALWEGGLVFYGGLIAGAFTLIYYCKKHDIAVWKMLDIGAPAVAFVHMFGRIGCLAAGCCYGAPTDLPWGIHFHNPDGFARPLHTALHPTQLYEAVSLFFIFCFLYFFLSKRKKFDGQLVFTYLFSYSIIRFIVEFFRGDEIRGYVIPNLISTSQFVSILILLVTSYFFIKKLKDQA